MIKRWPQAMIILGSILVLIGIAAVYLKANSELKLADLTSGNPNYIRPDPTSFDVFIIRFPAIELAIMGAVLQIAGYLGVRSRAGPNSRK